MKRRLHTRLRLRRFGAGSSRGSHCQLDLRVAGLSGERVVLRDPTHPEWPRKGRSARTLPEALAWVDTYVDELGPAWFRGEKDLQTVSEFGWDYLKELERQTDGGRTHASYSSAFRTHIEPVLGEGVMRTLTPAQVQALLDGVRTKTGTKPGKALRVTVQTVLSNVWRHAFPSDGDPPWAGRIKLDSVRPAVRRRRRARSGERRHDGQRGYAEPELRQIMIAAVALDLLGDANPRKRRGINNYAETLASLIYQIVRVEELTFVRHQDVHLNLKAVCVPGTKTAASADRFAPIQEGYLPWLKRALSRGAREDDFLLPTSDVRRLPNVDVIKGKVARVLVAAGLKRAGQCTNTFRATGISFALGVGFTADAVAVLAGHRLVADPLITQHYLRWTAFLRGLGPRAHDFVPSLGTPEELEEEARRAIRDHKLDR